jgi:DNA-directed RNA polymerases I, II, and III subunit RPABC2
MVEDDEETLNLSEDDDESENENENENEDIDVDEDVDDDDVEQEQEEEDVEELKDSYHYDGEGGGDDSDEENEEDGDDNYLQKFNEEIRKNYIADFHPECVINNYEEVRALVTVVRDSAGNVVDDLHKTVPYLTKYEKTRIIGQRAKQINSGAKAFVKVPETIIDGYLIAEMELIQKKIPFIIRRPTPSGGCEYWNLKDLDVISF